MEQMQQLVFKYRIKDKHAKRLAAQARAVNIVWNYCNETQQKAAKAHRKWLTGYDLVGLSAGAVDAGLDLHSHTIQRVCLEYAKSRGQQRKPWLRWRGRKSLGWVPFNTGHIVFRDGAFVFRGKTYSVWLDRPIPEGAAIGAGSFNQDSCGHWYLNVPVEVETANVASIDKVGIDLGLSSLVALSNGETIQAPQFYRKSEAVTGVRTSCTRRARDLPRDMGSSSSAMSVRQRSLGLGSQRVCSMRAGRTSSKCCHTRPLGMVAARLRSRSVTQASPVRSVAHCLLRGRKVSQGCVTGCLLATIAGRSWTAM